MLFASICHPVPRPCRRTGLLIQQARFDLCCCKAYGCTWVWYVGANELCCSATTSTVQTALEARSKIGVKPKRKYVRKKGVQAGSEQPSQATEMGQETQPMNGMESAHSGSGLDASSPGALP